MGDSLFSATPKTEQPPQSTLLRSSMEYLSGTQGQASADSGQVTKAEFEALAAFRHAIRRFLRFSEQEARKAGITPQQHQLLLAIKGYPNRESATVSELAERLQMRQHSMVGLIDRTEAQGLVRRESGVVDRRQVYIFLTPLGEELLCKLAIIHRRELHSMSEVLRLPIWESGSHPES
jgi:DNA-binding MarR family transcriptional regulator